MNNETILEVFHCHCLIDPSLLAVSLSESISNYHKRCIVPSEKKFGLICGIVMSVHPKDFALFV